MHTCRESGNLNKFELRVRYSNIFFLIYAVTCLRIRNNAMHGNLTRGLSGLRTVSGKTRGFTSIVAAHWIEDNKSNRPRPSGYNVGCFWAYLGHMTVGQLLKLANLHHMASKRRKNTADGFFHWLRHWMIFSTWDIFSHFMIF